MIDERKLIVCECGARLIGETSWLLHKAVNPEHRAKDQEPLTETVSNAK